MGEQDFDLTAMKKMILTCLLEIKELKVYVEEGIIFYKEKDQSAMKRNLYHMSLVLRKPVFGVSDQVRHKPGCTAIEDG